MRLLILLVVLSGCATTQKIVVATDRGPLVGRVGAGLREFRGIPYAAPPVGELRWKPPVAAAAWRHLRFLGRALKRALAQGDQRLVRVTATGLPFDSA